MISIINEKIYDMALISKVKKQTGSKKLKKIVNYLRNLSKADVKTFSELKIKTFEEEKKQEFKISAPIIEFQHYFEAFKKSLSKSNLNNNDVHEGENAPSTVDDNEEEIKQIESSDFSDDE